MLRPGTEAPGGRTAGGFVLRVRPPGHAPARRGPLRLLLQFRAERADHPVGPAEPGVEIPRHAARRSWSPPRWPSRGHGDADDARGWYA